jgi:hypothetical protein
MSFLKMSGLFVVTAIAEILGCYLTYVRRCRDCVAVARGWGSADNLGRGWRDHRHNRDAYHHVGGQGSLMRCVSG